MASLVSVEESLVNPELKKQKVEEISDDDISEEEEEDSDWESDESHICDPPLSDFGGDEKLREQWLLRRQKLKDSDGFDVGPYNGTLIDGCYLMDLDEDGDDSLYLKSLNKCAHHAVDYWNKDQGEELKLSKVLKAVYASSRGNLFYLTLEAEVGSSGVKKVYETKVMDDFIVKKIKVFLFRAKKADKN